MKKLSLLEEDIGKLYRNYLIASVGGMLGTSLYVLGDTMIVGRALGSQGLAALNISIPMINVFNGFGLLFGIGGATAVSINRGQGRAKDLDNIFNTSMLMAFIVGIILSLVRIFYLDELVLILGGSEASFDMARSYLGILMSFSLAFLLNSSLTVFVRNDGNPRLAMAAMLISSLANVILDYLFMVVLDWGMAGGALATGLSPVLGLAILSLHFIRGDNSIAFRKFKLKASIFKRVIRNGFASFIIELSAGLAIFAFNLVLIDIKGDLGVSAYSIIANLSLICTAIFTGVGQAIQPIVSVNHGANREDRVLESVRLGLRTALILGIGFFLLGQLFPKSLHAIFSKDRSELMKLTSRGIRLYFIAFLIMGLNIVVTSYIQSKENRSLSTLISLLRGFIYLIICLLILPKYLGLDGVWLTMPAAELLTMLTYTIFIAETRELIKLIYRKR